VSANAAKDAAKLQSDAADKAIALQKEQFAYQQELNAPLVASGRMGNKMVNDMMGLPTEQTAPLSFYGNTGQKSAGRLQPGKAAVPVSGQPPAQPQAAGRVQPLATYAGQTPANQAAQRTQSGYVTMQAPNGETKAVPPQQVPHFLSLGAQVIQ
jgi:hypothetical protein